MKYLLILLLLPFAASSQTVSGSFRTPLGVVNLKDTTPQQEFFRILDSVKKSNNPEGWIRYNGNPEAYEVYKYGNLYDPRYDTAAHMLPVLNNGKIIYERGYRVTRSRTVNCPPRTLSNGAIAAIGCLETITEEIGYLDYDRKPLKKVEIFERIRP